MTCHFKAEEQLYLLEAYVDNILLSPEKKDTTSGPLRVQFKFSNLPILEINQVEFRASEFVDSSDCLIQFEAGKSCIISKTSDELLETIKNEPIIVEVYKADTKIVAACESKIPPLFSTRVLLHDCVCEKIANVKSIKIDDSYCFKNSYNLLDANLEPSGTILLSLRFLCLGKSIDTQFAHHDNAYLFKNPNSSANNEFQCEKIDDYDDDKREDKSCQVQGSNWKAASVYPKAQSIMTLGPVCRKFEIDKSSTAQSQPELFCANRNDGKEVVERKTSDCYSSSDSEAFLRSLRQFPCNKSGCGNVLCTDGYFNNVRSAHKMFNVDLHNALNNEPIANPPDKMDPSCSRMRGGGCCGNRDCQDRTICAAEETSVKDQILQATQSITTLITGACKPSGYSTFMDPKPGCCCFGQTGTGKMYRGAGGCSNSPCMGIDCLIRSFNEAQDFVDSIGQVPGLAGLGIMDPAESPYFNRVKDDAPSTCAPKPVICAPPPQKKSLCGKQVAKPVDSRTSPCQFAKNTQGNSEGGRAQESLAGKARKKEADNKIDKSKDNEMENKENICGQLLRCAAGLRSKSPNVEQSHLSKSTTNLKIREKTKSLPRMSQPQMSSPDEKPQSKPKSPAKKKKRREKRETFISKKKSHEPGPNGDFFPTSHSNVKVSKDITRRVELMAKNLPNIYCGHKDCLDLHLLVPKNMGWYWNSIQTPWGYRPRLGWKPGAIAKHVYHLLKMAKRHSNEPLEHESAVDPSMKGKRGKMSRKGTPGFVGRGPRKSVKEEIQEIELPPTMHIHRKNGTYYVTMNPVRPDLDLDEYVKNPPKPLQFKVTKDRDDNSIASSSTAEDMEFEFSPPTAITHYRTKPEICDMQTQVKHQEIIDSMKRAKGTKNKSKKSKK